MALVISLAGTAEQDSPFGADDFPATLTNVGDLFTVQLFVYSPTITCTSIAITGTGTVQGGALTNRYQYTTVFFGGTDIEMWSGIVTGTGTVTVTCTFSASVAGLDVAYSPREFTVSGTANPVWTILDATHLEQASGAGGTTVLLPSITPPAANYAYMGYAYSGSTPTAGSTSGYEYDTDYLNGFWVYNPQCTSSAQQPSFTQPTTNDGFAGMGALILATPQPLGGFF
jgi:hypothetical protein